MLKRIFWEVVGVQAFLAFLILGVPAVLSLQKPKMPAAQPLFEPLAALKHLSLPVQYDISVTQSGQGVKAPRTRYYAVASTRHFAAKESK